MSLGVVSLLLLASTQTQATLSASPSPLPAEVDATGTWKGTTSQGHDIEIQVDTNKVKLLRVGWEIKFEKECLAPDGRLPQRGREGLHVMRYQHPEPVRAGRLKTRLGVGSDLDLLVNGTFAADGTASGDIHLSTVPGTPCAGKATATWKATRQ